MKTKEQVKHKLEKAEAEKAIVSKQPISVSRDRLSELRGEISMLRWILQ